MDQTKKTACSLHGVKICFTKLFAFLAAGLLFSCTMGVASTPSEAAARRIANGLIAETTWRLMDTATGNCYESSEGLAPSPTVLVESRFNGWYYQTLMVMQGMTRLGEVLNESAYGAFSEKNLDFVARHEAYFRQQRAAGMIAKPMGEKPEARIGYYFDFPSLWMTGLAPLWIERGRMTGGEVYRDYTQRFAHMVDKNGRQLDGLLANNGLVIRADDVYLTVPGILELWKLEKNPARLEDAIQQTVGGHKVLFQPEAELYRHSYEPKKGLYSTAYWGRGNGWMALSHVYLLANIPAGYPRRAEALAAYRQQMAGLRRYQAPEGGWYQVMDHPESWIETSCTGMFAYALARGVNEGWLDPSYAADARKGWHALLGKATPEGKLRDICPSTSPGDLKSYMSRPRKEDDIHGYGPFLLAAAEMIRMEKKAAGH